MRAGKLNKKVSIEAPIGAIDPDGGAKPGWNPVAQDVWAAIEPLRGREWFEAGSTQSEVDHRIRMRYRGGIDESMRVVHKKRVFDVQYVLDVKTENRELQLMCKEHAGGS